MATNGRPPAAHPPSILPGLAVLGLLWGITFPVVRWGVSAGASPFLLVGADFAVAAGAMAAVAAARGSIRPTGRGAAESALLGVLLVGGINVLLFWGVQFSSGGAASIVFATSPLLSLPLARRLGSPLGLGPRAYLALALGLAGVVAVGAPSLGGTLASGPWGVVALLGGAGAQALGATLVARRRPLGETEWGQAAQFLGGTALALAATVAFEPGPVLPPTGAVVGSLLYVALLTGVVGYSIFFTLIHRAGPVRANLVTYLNPLVALGVGVLVFGEGWTLSEIAGLLLVLAALTLARSPRDAPSPRSAAPPGPVPSTERRPGTV